MIIKKNNLNAFELLRFFGSKCGVCVVKSLFRRRKT